LTLYAIPNPVRSQGNTETTPQPRVADRTADALKKTEKYKTKAGVSKPYPIPHKSWIRQAAVAYQNPSVLVTSGRLNSSGMWYAENIDLFDWSGLYQSTIWPLITAQTNAGQLIYDNVYSQSLASGPFDKVNDKDAAMRAWCTANGVTLETMYLHYARATVVNLAETPGNYTLSAGSRVPTYGWKGTPRTVPVGQRVIMNAHNVHFRAFNAAWQLSQLKSHPNLTGIFVDNSAYDTSGGQMQTGFVNNVGGGKVFQEYEGTTIGAAATSFMADLVKVFAAMRSAFGSTYTIYPNLSELYYPNWTAIFPHINGCLREQAIRVYVNDAGRNASFASQLAEMAAAHAAGVPQILSVYGNVSGGAPQPATSVSLLAQYYVLANSSDYYCAVGDVPGYGGDPLVYDHIPATDYNVGAPAGSPYVFAAGADPTSAHRDSGTSSRWARPGGQYVMTDPTKNWPVNQWAGSYIKDPAGSIYKIHSNTATTLSLYYSASPAPADGSYALATFFYKVYAKNYSNAIAFWRPLPEGTITTHDKTTNVTLPLPSGTWYLLNGDFSGTVSNTNRVTSVTMGNLQGAIVVRRTTSPGGHSPKIPIRK